MQKIIEDSNDNNNVNNAWILEITQLNLAREIVFEQSRDSVQEK